MVKLLRTRMASVLAICALILCLGAQHAKAQPYPSTSYRLSEDGKTLLEWTGPETVIDMTRDPILNKVEYFNEDDGKTFDSNNNITKLVLPSALKVCPEYAIYSCNNLKLVDAFSATNLEVFYLFANEALTTVYFPVTNTLKEIHLIGCTAVKSLNVTRLPNLKILEFHSNSIPTPVDLSQNKDLEELYIYYYKGSLNYPLHYNTKLKVLEFGSFAELRDLDVTILPDLEKLRVARCPNLSRVDLSSNFKITGENSSLHGAFSNCTNLKEVRLPVTIKEISGYAFEGCKSLYILDLTKYASLKTIGQDAFKGLNIVKLPASVETLPEVGCQTIYWYCRTPKAPTKIFGSLPYVPELYIPYGVTRNFINAGWKPCTGSIKEMPEKYCKVTSRVEGQGEIIINGYFDLNKVPVGTILTAVVTPKDRDWHFEYLGVNGHIYENQLNFSVMDNSVVTGYFSDGPIAYPKSSYRLSDDGKTLLAWTGPETVINMTKDPILNKVEKIYASGENGAFNGNQNITELELPKALKECKDYALYDCQDLVEVDASNCTQLQTLVIGECGYVEKLSLPKTNTLQTLDIYTCPEITALDVTPYTNLKVLKFGSAVIDKPIDLSKNKNLEEFALDSYSGTVLYDLSHLTKLKKITFEYYENIKQFDGAPFTNLESVHFITCNKLERVDLSKNMKITGLNGALNKAFSECDLLSEVKLPTSLKELGEKAFFANYAIKQLDLSQYTNLTTVGPYAFNSINTVKLPASVKTFPPLDCSIIYWYNKAPAKPLEYDGSKPSMQTLYIPYGTTQKYKDAGWDKCAKEIIEMEQMEFVITTKVTGNGTLVIKKDGKPLDAEALKAVKKGVQLTVEATPAANNKLAALMVDDRVINSGDIFTVHKNATVSATFTPFTFEVKATHSGEGTLVIKKDGKALNAEALKAVAYGTKLTVEATPAAGYKLTALTIDGKAVNSGVEITIQANTAIIATFTIQSFEVTATHSGEGTLVVKKDGKALNAEALKAIEYGTKLTVEATPAAGYKLTALTIDGKAVNSGDAFTIKGNTAVVATFALQTFEVTVTHSGEGTLVIKKDGKALNAEALKAVAYGTKLTVEATPAAHYKLTALTIDGKAVNSGVEITIQANTAIIATFTIQSFEVKATHSGEGTLVIKKDGKALNAEALKAIEYGTKLTVEATPATGYKLAALTIDGKAVNSGDAFTIQANTAVVATFTKETANEAIEHNEVSAKRLQADRITLELPAPAHYELFTITGERILAAYNSGRIDIPVESNMRYILRVTMQNGNIRIFKL